MGHQPPSAQLRGKPQGRAGAAMQRFRGPVCSRIGAIEARLALHISTPSSLGGRWAELLLEKAVFSGSIAAWTWRKTTWLVAERFCDQPTPGQVMSEHSQPGPSLLCSRSRQSGCGRRPEGTRRYGQPCRQWCWALGKHRGRRLFWCAPLRMEL